MDQRANKAISIIPVLLASIVLTQIIYIAKSTYKIEIPSFAIWSVEAVLFLALAVSGLVAMLQKGQNALAFAAIAMGAMLNVFQVGMGMTMFTPLSDAGTSQEAVYGAVVAMAFFLYFSGKLLFGFAAVSVGQRLMRETGSNRIAGLLAIASGLIAILVNFGGMAIGMAWLYPAGATGTLATLFLALALNRHTRIALLADR